MRDEYLLDIRNKVFSCLRYGGENAVKGADLAVMLNKEKRTAQRYIQLLRRDLSAPIISTGHGYYLTDDKAEVEAFVERCMKEGRGRFVTVKKLREGLRDDPEQMELDVYSLGDDHEEPENNLKERNNDRSEDT